MSTIAKMSIVIALLLFCQPLFAWNGRRRKARLGGGANPNADPNATPAAGGGQAVPGTTPSATPGYAGRYAGWRRSGATWWRPRQQPGRYPGGWRCIRRWIRRRPARWRPGHYARRHPGGRWVGRRGGGQGVTPGTTPDATQGGGRRGGGGGNFIENTLKRSTPTTTGRSMPRRPPPARRPRTWLSGSSAAWERNRTTRSTIAELVQGWNAGGNGQARSSAASTAPSTGLTSLKGMGFGTSPTLLLPRVPLPPLSVRRRPVGGNTEGGNNGFGGQQPKQAKGSSAAANDKTPPRTGRFHIGPPNARWLPDWFQSRRQWGWANHHGAVRHELDARVSGGVQQV